MIALQFDPSQWGTVADWVAAVGVSAALFATYGLLREEQKRNARDLRVDVAPDSSGGYVVHARNFGGVPEVIFTLGLEATGAGRPANPYGVTNTLPDLPAGVIAKSALRWNLDVALLRVVRMRDVEFGRLSRELGETRPMPVRVFIERGTGERTYANTMIDLPPIIS